MDERQQLEMAIAALEDQRALLGDAVIDVALAPLNEKLAKLKRGGPIAEHEALGERRVVSALFCDVTGSTAMAEGLDPEIWTGIMNEAFELLNEPVVRFGGSVNRLMGDGLLAFFGAEEAHEDDPQRAVSAGLAMLENVQPLHEKLSRERGLNFNVRVGINTGLAVVGDVGSDVFGEFTAMGDTVNLAARMEQTAEPGTLQITEYTYRLVAAHFECRSLGPVVVKGKSEAVAAYHVLSRKGDLGAVRGLTAHGISSPLVGREAEVEAAQAAVARLINGEGGILSIIGEAGIGKSRLLEDIHRGIPTGQIRWLEGHTLSYGQNISYWPFQQILWSYTGITEEDDEAAAWAKLEHKIVTLFPDDSTAVLPYLANLLAMDPRGEVGQESLLMDSEGMGLRLYAAARRFFRRLAQEQPLVMVFEDLHWVDDSSAALLQHLLPLIKEQPLLIMGISRPDRRAQTDALRKLASEDFGQQYTEIQLAPLAEDQSQILAANLLKLNTMSQAMREMIVGKSEGNPLYLEEIIRALIDTKAIKRDPASGQWQAAGQMETITLPDTLQGLIMARVDQLEGRVKQVLRTAAVIGRTFLYRILESVFSKDVDLDDGLAELQVVELIQEKQRLPELEYIFKHVLVQEATYENILLQTRRKLHAQVGGAIEELFGDRLEEFYGLLAYHYARAESWEKAQDFLFKAADQEGRMAADAEALANYGQALSAYERAFGDRWDPLQKATLDRKMGEALLRRGENAQAVEYLEQALALLGYNFPASTWGRRLAIVREVGRQIGHRTLPGLFLREPYVPPIGTVEDIGRLFESLVATSMAVDPERWLFFVLKMLNFSERCHHVPGIIGAAAILGFALDTIPIPSQADYYGQKAVDLAEKSDQRGASVLAYAFWAIHANIRGQWDDTLYFAQRALDVQRERAHWNTFGWLVGTMSMADGHIHLGNFKQALVYGQRLVDFGHDSGDMNALSYGLARVGFAQKGLGEIETAVATLQSALEASVLGANYANYVDASGDLGQCFLRLGQYVEAFAVFEECQQLSIEHNLMKSPVKTRYVNGLAEAHLLAAEKGDTKDQRDQLQAAHQACDAALKQGKVYIPGMPEAQMLRGTYEWLRGKRGAAEKWWGRSVSLAEELNVSFELGRTLLEMGRRLGDRNSLRRAEGIFTETESGWELARTRELLSSDN